MSGPPQSRRTFLRRGGGAVAALSGAGTLALAGCSVGGSAERVTVEMTDESLFDPESVTIAQGGTVTWTNVGRVDHTITAYEDRIPSDADYFASGGFESESAARRNLSRGLVGPDETYEHTFGVAGAYEYFCVPHERAGMVGTVTVE